jgi:hypothetical protein
VRFKDLQPFLNSCQDSLEQLWNIQRATRTVSIHATIFSVQNFHGSESLQAADVWQGDDRCQLWFDRRGTQGDACVKRILGGT